MICSKRPFLWGGVQTAPLQHTSHHLEVSEPNPIHVHLAVHSQRVLLLGMDWITACITFKCYLFEIWSSGKNVSSFYSWSVSSFYPLNFNFNFLWKNTTVRWGKKEKSEKTIVIKSYILFLLLLASTTPLHLNVQIKFGNFFILRNVQIWSRTGLRTATLLNLIDLLV